MAKRAKKPPAEPAPAGAPDPAPNSREDLGYSKPHKGRLDPDQLAELERCSEALGETRKAPADLVDKRKLLAGEIKPLRRRQNDIMDQMDAVRSGSYQPGLPFDAPPEDEEGKE